MIFTNKLIALISALLLLTACAQLRIVSSVTISQSRGSESVLLDLQSKIIERAIQRDGSCIELNPDISLMVCSISDDEISISSGYNRDGVVFITLNTVRGFLLPKSQSKIESGVYVTDTHMAWEEWIISTFGHYGFDEKERQYPDFDIKQEF